MLRNSRLRQSLALWSALFFIANWVIGASTIAIPITILDKSWLWGVSVICFCMYFMFIFL